MPACPNKKQCSLHMQAHHFLKRGKTKMMLLNSPDSSLSENFTRTAFYPTQENDENVLFCYSKNAKIILCLNMSGNLFLSFYPVSQTNSTKWNTVVVFHLQQIFFSTKIFPKYVSTVKFTVNILGKRCHYVSQCYT